MQDSRMTSGMISDGFKPRYHDMNHIDSYYQPRYQNSSSSDSYYQPRYQNMNSRESYPPFRNGSSFTSNIQNWVTNLHKGAERPIFTEDLALKEKLVATKDTKKLGTTKGTSQSTTTNIPKANDKVKSQAKSGKGIKIKASVDAEVRSPKIPTPNKSFKHHRVDGPKNGNGTRN